MTACLGCEEALHDMKHRCWMCGRVPTMPNAYLERGQHMTDTEQTDAAEMAELKACPHCGENLVGNEIEPTRRDFYGNRTHYSKLIGVSNGDSVMFYKCPACEQRIERSQANLGGAGQFRTFDVEIER